jgi:hypothetical protein
VLANSSSELSSSELEISYSSWTKSSSSSDYSSLDCSTVESSPKSSVSAALLGFVSLYRHNVVADILLVHDIHVVAALTVAPVAA